MSGLPIPNGPDEDRGPTITAALWSFSGIAIASQFMRLYCRIKFRALGWDDWWMFFTTLLLLAFAITVEICMEHGGGRHLYYLAMEDPANLALVGRLNWISQPFSIAAVGTGKISVGLLIIRYLYTRQPLMRVSIWVCMISVNVILAVAILLTFLQCDPPHKLWDTQVPGTCLNPYIQAKYSVFAATYSATGDIFLALLPVKLIWNLQMPQKRRIGLCLIFSAGVLAGICGYYKTSKILGLGAHSDITWESYEAFLFTGAEIWLIILCGTVPTIKPLYDEMWTRVSSLASGSFSKSGSGAAGSHSSTDLTNNRQSSVEKLSSYGSGVHTDIVSVDREPPEREAKIQAGEICVRHSLDVDVSAKDNARINDRPWDFEMGSGRASLQR